MSSRYDKIVKKGGGGFFGKFMATVAFLGWSALGFIASFIVCMFIESLLPSKHMSDLAVTLIMLPMSIAPMIWMMLPVKKPVKKEKLPAEAKAQARRAKRRRIFARIRKKAGEVTTRMPYFGSMFSRSQILDSIKKETFHPYTAPDGSKRGFVRVSESDKWVMILGRYIPVDLIYGYNKEENVLYTIDGNSIQLPALARSYHIAADIESFFEERGMYYKEAPAYTARNFRSVIAKHGNDLSTADWGRVRYQWEKNIARSAHPDTVVKNGKFKATIEKNQINPEIYERVLSDSELHIMYNAALCNNVPLEQITDFASYMNEFCVCNGVKVLEMLKYPKNSAGMDFLFECLGDLDEAYFSLAVTVLSKFPRDILMQEIEKRARLYHEAEDALRLAGILFLAKEIKYDIKYVEAVKEGVEIAAIDGSSADAHESASDHKLPSALEPSSLIGTVETTEDGLAKFVAVSTGAPIAFETEN